jgi:hypothetical protein
MLVTVEHRNSAQSQRLSLAMPGKAHKPKETVMNTILSAAIVRRTVVSTLTAAALAVALPQAGFAQVSTEVGMWKMNPANSNSGTLSLEQHGQARAADAGRLIVVHKSKAYAATGQTARDIIAGKRVDESKLTLIGTHVRSTTRCNFRCQDGQPERQATLSFIPMDASGGPRSVVASSK